MMIEAGNKMLGQSLEALPAGWLVLDLEVRTDRSGIRLAAYLWEQGEHRLEPPEGERNLTKGQVRELVDRVRGATVVMGHNIRAFDLPILFEMANEEVPAGLADRICDTLELSSLFRVGQPTHRLEKLYKLSQSNNDPLEDCRESYKLFQEIEATLHESSDSLCPEVRHWAYRLLPKQSFILRRGWITPSHHSRLDYPGIECERESLRQYLQSLIQQKGYSNFGAVVFLAWLSKYQDSEAHRPTWTAMQFLSFREAEMKTFAFSVLRELKFFFGFEDFKLGQREIVESLLSREVVPLGILPTGAGKSLCFQLPALIFSKYYRELTVVVSPLQALMEDQVKGLQETLKKQGLESYAERVDLLAGNQTPKKRKETLEKLAHGQIDLIYLSPERLRHPSVRRVLVQRHPRLWVLDEAHTLSQWGHDFRPDFLRITKGIKEIYQQKMLQAPQWGFVTATATVKVIEDIEKVHENCKELLEGDFQRLPQKGRQFSWRTELKTAIESYPYCTPRQLDQSDRLKRAAELIDLHFAEVDVSVKPVAIIYVPTRDDAKFCAKALCEMQFNQAHNLGRKFRAKAYHSGVDSSIKQQVLKEFRAGELDIVVATSAFGMGIDRQAIRVVIHLTPPQTPEAYIQEIGRLARKAGEEGFAYLFLDGTGARDFDWIFQRESEGRILSTGQKKSVGG